MFSPLTGHSSYGTIHRKMEGISLTTHPASTATVEFGSLPSAQPWTPTVPQSVSTPETQWPGTPSPETQWPGTPSPETQWPSPQTPEEVGEGEQGSDGEEVEVFKWSEAQRRLAHKIWQDTVTWEQNPKTAAILTDLDSEWENLPPLELKTYSTFERPRRQGPRRFSVRDCWMFFCDVPHAVWIDANGYPDLSQRCELTKQEGRRTLIPSAQLCYCGPEQLKEQQETIAELKRFTEQQADTDFVAGDLAETDEGDSDSNEEATDSELEDSEGEDMVDSESEEESAASGDTTDDGDETTDSD